MAVNLAQELQYFDGLSNAGVIRKVTEAVIDAINHTIKVTAAAGSTAGALTAPGVAVGDELLSVVASTDGDILSETTITDTDEVTTTTTDTTGETVYIVFRPAAELYTNFITKT